MVLEELHTKFPETQIVAMTSLPRDERNRRKLVELTKQYVDERHGVSGWIVTDQLQPDWKTADFCVAGLTTALSNAQLADDEATQLNNVFTLAFTEQPGGMLALHYVHDSLPGYEWRVDGELLGYSVNGQRLVEVSQLVLRTIEEGKGTSSVFLPLGEPGTSIYDVLMTNVGWSERHQRDDLQWLSDRIEAGYQEAVSHLAANGGRSSRQGLLYGLANYHLKFGSLSTLINPAQPACQVIAVRLAAIKNGTESIHELAAVPATLLLPHEQVHALPSVTNGQTKRRGGRR